MASSTMRRADLKILHRFFCACVALAAAWSPPGTLHAAQSDTILVEVQAGEHARDATPVSLPLPRKLAKEKHLWMQRLDRGTEVPVQRTASDPPELVWIVDRLALRQSIRYRISASTFDRPRETHVQCDQDSRSLNFKVRGKPVLAYHTAIVPAPPGVDPVYQRSGFIHPLFTPHGQILTEAFPADHLHQHGIFNAWVKATFDGRPVDFWNQAGGTGQVVHRELQSITSGPVFAEFQVWLDHIDISAKPDPITAINETWTVRVYDRSDVFIVDLNSQQSAATEQPVVLEEYHYGGMAFRGNSKWLGADASRFLTSDGKDRVEGNHTRPRWTDLSGLLDGRPCGVAVLQHPDNPRFPAPVRLHPQKPYFVYSPVVLGPMTIAPDESLSARYRYIVHSGEPDEDELDAAWADFAEPPEVRILE